jgi:hypothetical protein
MSLPNESDFDEFSNVPIPEKSQSARPKPGTAKSPNGRPQQQQKEEPGGFLFVLSQIRQNLQNVISYGKIFLVTAVAIRVAPFLFHAIGVGFAQLLGREDSHLE